MREIKDPNRIFYAELNEWHATDAFQSFSLKYVMDGLVTYRNGNTLHTVKTNQVLAGNKQPGVVSYFEFRKLVKSKCVNIKVETMPEIYALLSEKNDTDPDRLLGGDHRQPGFPERIHTISHNDFLAPLRHVAGMLQAKREGIEIGEEFFLDFSGKISFQLFKDCRLYENLGYLRASTKKEIVRRLAIARNFLQEDYLQRPTVKELARFCNMSEFHFFRAFPQAFNITPHQFHLKLKLEKASELTMRSSLAISEIAEKCSFSDISTFCKDFKRMYGITPSSMRDRSHRQSAT